jgi:hypothetical protein
MAQIYAAQGQPFIIAPLHFNSAGIYYEQDLPLKVPRETAGALALQLRHALELFSLKEANLRQHKLTDWPSFRASGSKSVRSFREDYLRIDVRSVNEAEQRYIALVQPKAETDITLQATLNFYESNDEVERLIHRLLDCCLK